MFIRIFATFALFYYTNYFKYKTLFTITAWFFNHIFRGDKDNPQIGWMMMISTDIWSSVLRH